MVTPQELIIIKRNERSEYSYIGHADFLFNFQEKVLKFVHAQFWFFAVWLFVVCDFFKFSENRT